jgi:hypothetical protein
LLPATELDRNLLVANWNLHAFGGLTEKWLAEAKDSLGASDGITTLRYEMVRLA